MKYVDCTPVNSFAVESIVTKKPRHCKAVVKMFLLNEPQKIMQTLEREDHFNGVGIIELEIEYEHQKNDYFRLIFSEVRGMELDPENELDYLVTYGKEYIFEDLQPKLGCPITVVEPEAHFVAMVSNGDQWFISL